MKKPPDVIVGGSPLKESPLLKWMHLAEWAIRNGDNYLYCRAQEMIKKLKNQQ